MPSRAILPLVDLMYVLSVRYVSFINSYFEIHVVDDDDDDDDDIDLQQ